MLGFKPSASTVHSYFHCSFLVSFLSRVSAIACQGPETGVSVTKDLDSTVTLCTYVRTSRTLTCLTSDVDS